MEMIADELVEKGVGKNNIIYINLNKRGYKNIKSEEKPRFF
jgi:hypothetical protein